MVVIVNRTAVAVSDYAEDHERRFEISPSSRVLDLVREALKICPLVKTNGKAVWTIALVDRDLKEKRSIGLIAEQWSEPKLVVSGEETVESLFVNETTGLFFDYCPNYMPDAALQAVRENRPVPGSFSEKIRIQVDEEWVPVREIERMKSGYSSVMIADDGTLFLCYPVSVGPFHVDIVGGTQLSSDQVAGHLAGSLDLGELAAAMSEQDQNSGKYERKDLKR